MNGIARRLAALLAATGIWLLSGGGFYDRLSGRMTAHSAEERMKNVTVLTAVPTRAPAVPRRLMQAMGLAPPKESFSGEQCAFPLKPLRRR